MASKHCYERWRPDALLPALIVVGPYYFNKLIYVYFPSYPAFVAADYACRTLSLAFLYLLLRSQPTSLPIPWRLAVSSTKELLTALVGAITLIGFNVVGMTFIQYLNAHSWQITRFPLPTSVLQYFDSTVGMVFVGLSEEAVFRFYLINLLLLRGISCARAIIVSTLIFAGIHWSYGAGAMAFAMLAGLILSMIFMSARNLIAPIITHAAFDAFNFAGGVAFLWRFYSRAW
jgi:membrane protease YdiL (CAAX protease family)